MATRSPFSTPSSLSALAAFWTSRWRSRVGQGPGVARLADPVVGDLVAEAALDVPVDAVVGDVELAAAEPLGERQVPLEGRVERLGPAHPVPGDARPEALEVALGLLVELRLRVGLGRELGRRREDAALCEQRQRFDLGSGRGRLNAHGCLLPVDRCILRGQARGVRADVRSAASSRSPAGARPRPGSPARSSGCRRRVRGRGRSRPRARSGRAREHDALAGAGSRCHARRNAASRRLRNSPGAAQRSSARTVPRTLRVTP